MTVVFPLPDHLDGRPAVLSDGFHTLDDVKARRARRQHRGGDFMYRRRARAEHPQHPYGSPWYEVPLPADLGGYDVPVLAPETSGVVLAEDSPTGWWVVLELGEGRAVACHHMRSVLVVPGAVVGAGTPLGILGGSPRAGDYGLWHLHFDRAEGVGLDVARMRRDNRIDGHFVDPLPYLASARHVLLADVPGGFGDIVPRGVA